MAEEKRLENKLKTYLKSVGVYPLGTPSDKMQVPPVGYYEKRWGGGFGKAGLPDMHICVKGHSIEVELKATNGRLSELQRVMLAQINRSHGEAYVIYPSEFDNIKQVIERYL